MVCVDGGAIGVHALLTALRAQNRAGVTFVGEEELSHSLKLLSFMFEWVVAKDHQRNMAGVMGRSDRLMDQPWSVLFTQTYLLKSTQNDLK